MAVALEEPRTVAVERAAKPLGNPPLHPRAVRLLVGQGLDETEERPLGLELIKEAGPDGLTLREVARRAGVSHNAPYPHFPDKDALVTAIASEGFGELGKSMTLAMADESSPTGRLQRAGLAYVEFARRRPSHFRVMFRPRKDAVSREIANAVFGVVEGLIREGQEADLLRTGDPTPLARTAWSLVHGIAELVAAGVLVESKRNLAAFVDTATETLVAGMKEARAKLPA